MGLIDRILLCKQGRKERRKEDNHRTNVDDDNKTQRKELDEDARGASIEIELP